MSRAGLVFGLLAVQEQETRTKKEKKHKEFSQSESNSLDLRNHCPQLHFGIFTASFTLFAARRRQLRKLLIGTSAVNVASEAREMEPECRECSFP